MASRPWSSTSDNTGMSSSSKTAWGALKLPPSPRKLATVGKLPRGGSPSPSAPRTAYTRSLARWPRSSKDIVGRTRTPWGCSAMRCSKDVTWRWSRRLSAERANMGMAVVGDTRRGLRVRLVSLKIMISRGSCVAGAKLRMSARSPTRLFSRLTRCHSMPASTWQESRSPPEANHGARPSTVTQTLRPDRVSRRSSVDTGRVRKLWSPVLMSP